MELPSLLPLFVSVSFYCIGDNDMTTTIVKRGRSSCVLHATKKRGFVPFFFRRILIYIEVFVMKNRFSSGKSKRNHYNWFKGGEKCNPSKVTKYIMSDEELRKIQQIDGYSVTD